MKNLITLVLSLSAIILSAQDYDRFTDRNNDGRPHDPMADQMDFVPNEILVKFKDDVKINSGISLKSAGISSVDKVLKTYTANSLDKLFPTETKLKSARIVKDPLGQDMVIPSLHNIYKITLSQLKSTGNNPSNLFSVIEELKLLPEVEYAEPNYIFTIGDFKPEGPEMTMLEAMEKNCSNDLSSDASGLIPNDPLYNQQWGIPACNIDDVWNTHTGDSTSVIAIIDTGVDYLHPDLAKNIWINKQEIPGNGKDDDGNGKIDDIKGWDFINNDNDPKDDNSHGTHCAGIAAAVGNNNIGIAGVNWRAKIMPVKVIQSSGRGDAATIAQGVTYAANKGAKVISMSFGSYAESLTLKNALANSYATAVLVAAAGNDGIAIGPCMGCAPLYPAAYSFVVGVEANNPTNRAGFSNYDQDGPVFSAYAELHNYELKAPGTKIISTIPGGNYREYSGTSMAAAFLAGTVSLYKEKKQNESMEMLFGNFINSISTHIDLEKALVIIPFPRLDIISYDLKDTIDGDKDGRPDAGETLALFIKVRNTWGQANDVKVGISLGEFEDPSVAQIINNESVVGSVSAYANRSNTIPLTIKVKSDVVDGRELVFNLKTWFGNHQGEKSQRIVLISENGMELKGMIASNLTLYPNKHYIITDNIAIMPDITLIIKPGTIIKIEGGKSINVYGKINAIGNKDSTIVFTKRDMKNNWSGFFMREGSFLEFNYCKFEYGGSSMDIFEGTKKTLDIRNCIFSYIGPNEVIEWNNLENYFDRSCFYYNSCGFSVNNCKLLSCNVISNNNLGLRYINHLSGYFSKNNIFSNIQNKFELNIGIYLSGTPQEIKLDNLYLGTSNKEKLNACIIDFNDNATGSWVDISSLRNRPSTEAHGIVWKVVANGKDTQDEFDQLDPLGVGKHKFEVYYNRPMDIKFPPTVSMGVRYPYSQTSLAEDGTWSTDSTMYTVYGTVGLTTGDGINTIRVEGAKDPDHFEIPIEDRRFRVIVNAAGIASSEFMATPGLGKIKLEWNNAKLEDGLGYNMYRKELINDTTLSQPVLINNILITDTLYTDYSVTPNRKYFYYYKILRTNLAETDSSKMVAAIPLTASKGDANGDLSVNVLDVTSMVAYLLNNNPQPFIFEAADVNNDGQINVLDVVGTVNLILNPSKSAKTLSSETIKLYLQNDTLFVDAPVAIGAIQFDVTGVKGMEEVEKMTVLNGFESGFSIKDNTLRLIVYSLTGKTIPSGNHIPLLRLIKGSGITNIIFGDKNGTALTVNYLSTGLWNLRELGKEVAYLGQNYPNPLNQSTTIPIFLNEPVDEAVIRIFNINCQEVSVLHIKNPVIGENLLVWHSGINKGLMAYVLEVRRNNKQAICGVKKMIVK